MMSASIEGCYRQGGGNLRHVTCANLPAEERLLGRDMLACVRGGQDPIEEAAGMGQAQEAFRITIQKDPYGHYLKRVGDAGVVGVATVQGDSTATSVKEIAEATPGYIRSTWSSLVDAISSGSYLVTTAEVWPTCSSQLLLAVGW